LLFVCLLFHPIQLTEMNKDYSNINIKSNYKLERLSRYLNYEFSSIALFGLSFFYRVFLLLAILLSVPFTVYMIYVLTKEKRYGWIIFFFCFVVLPLIIIFLFIPNPLLILITLAPFFLYCFMLKTVVRSWISERKFRMQSLD
jgi:hypothetical protein